MLAFVNAANLFIVDLFMNLLSRPDSRHEISEIGGPEIVERCNRETNLGLTDPYVPVLGEFF